MDDVEASHPLDMDTDLAGEWSPQPPRKLKEQLLGQTQPSKHGQERGDVSGSKTSLPPPYSAEELVRSVRTAAPLSELVQWTAPVSTPDNYLGKVCTRLRMQILSCLHHGDDSGRTILEDLANFYLERSRRQQEDDITNYGETLSQETFETIAAEAFMWAGMLPGSDKSSQTTNIKKAMGLLQSLNNTSVAARTGGITGNSTLADGWFNCQARLIKSLCTLVDALNKLEQECANNPITDPDDQLKIEREVDRIYDSFEKSLSAPAYDQSVVFTTGALFLMQFALDSNRRFSSDPVLVYILGRKVRSMQIGLGAIGNNSTMGIRDSVTTPSYSLISFFASLQRDLVRLQNLSYQLCLDACLEVARRASILHSLRFVKEGLGMALEIEKNARYPSAEPCVVLSRLLCFEREPSGTLLQELITDHLRRLDNGVNLLAGILIARSFIILSVEASDDVIALGLNDKKLMNELKHAQPQYIHPSQAKWWFLFRHLFGGSGRSRNAPLQQPKETKTETLPSKHEISDRRQTLAEFGVTLANFVLKCAENLENDLHGKSLLYLIRLHFVGARYHYSRTRPLETTRVLHVTEALQMLRELPQNAFDGVNSGSTYWRAAVTDVRDLICIAALERDGRKHVHNIVVHLPLGPLRDYISSVINADYEPSPEISESENESQDS